MKSFIFYMALSLLTLTVIMPHDDTFTRQGETLIFSSTDPNLNSTVKKKLVDTFFEIYPKIKRDFNAKAPDSIRVKVDTSYGGVAYANDGEIVISSDWLEKKPKDTDVITHEAMHIVQNYPNGAGAGWLTEGIADYVRFKYGVDNAASGWSLPEYSKENSYTDSYRVMARFLVWLTQNYNEQLVQKLDRQMRNKMYSKSTWNDLTGKSLDALWQEYGENPNI